MPTIRQLSQVTLKELQEMLRWWRQIIKSELFRTMGPAPEGLPRIGPFSTRLFRTQGDNPADLADATYPTQVDGDGFRLPGKFLSVVYDVTAADPVTLAVQDDEQTHYIYSPDGWIPRLVDLRVSFRGGRFVADFVPNIPVRFDANVTAPDDVPVEIIRYGIANTQVFTAHLDFMAATTSATTDQEAFTWLNPRLKQWEIIERECS